MTRSIEDTMSVLNPDVSFNPFKVFFLEPFERVTIVPLLMIIGMLVLSCYYLADRERRAGGASLLVATVILTFLSAPMVSYFNGVIKNASEYNSKSRQECVASGGQWFQGGGGGLFSNPVPSQCFEAKAE